MSVEIRLIVTKPPNPDDSTVETFDLVSHGSVQIDHRYIPNVFHWIALQILKTNKSKKDITAHISTASMKITDKYNHSIVHEEHSFESIYRLSRLRNIHKDNYLAYITFGKADSSICMFYVFECLNHEVVSSYVSYFLFMASKFTNTFYYIYIYSFLFSWHKKEIL